MIPLLTPGLQKRALPLSVAAWHGLISQGLAPARAELLRGVIVEKMSKSILHTKLNHRLAGMLASVLQDRYWIRQEAPLTLADSEPEPDISVVPGQLEDFRSHPESADLVVEVSVSTLAEDRAMAALYAEAGVEEFLIVNAAARCIEVHRQPTGGVYADIAVCSEGQTLTCQSLPVSVDVSALFAGLAN